MIDIFINMFLAYEIENTNEMETRVSVIAKKYMKGWFLIDLFASLPFDVI